MKRQKYKAKNIHAYKRIFECDHPECKDHGIVTYREEPDSDHLVPVTRRRCIDHTHWQKPEIEARKPQANLYTAMIDHRKWLDMGNYNTGLGR